jgi:adenylate cyclase
MSSRGLGKGEARAARATVLFADLRGYTHLAETLAPVQVVPLLQEMFATLVPAAEEHGGQVLGMAGDSMMAAFGLQDTLGAGARDALLAARKMLERFAPVAERWRQDFSVTTGIGIGLHAGEVAWGMLGPPTNLAPTLVGDTVNVAARLCSRARAGEVLFSAAVAEGLVGIAIEPTAATETGPYLQLPQSALRGRKLPLDIWCMPVLERAAL